MYMCFPALNTRVFEREYLLCSFLRIVSRITLQHAQSGKKQEKIRAQKITPCCCMLEEHYPFARGPGSVIAIVFQSVVFDPSFCGCTGLCNEVQVSRFYRLDWFTTSELAVPSPVQHLRRSTRPHSHSSLCNPKITRFQNIRHSSPLLGFGLPLDRHILESPHPLVLIGISHRSHLRFSRHWLSASW